MGEIVGMCKTSSCNDHLSVINCTQWLPFLLLSQFLYSVAPHKLFKYIISILICEVNKYSISEDDDDKLLPSKMTEVKGMEAEFLESSVHTESDGLAQTVISVWQTPSPVKTSKAPLWEKSHLGRKRISMSPSPVAAAAPALSSAYAPAPGTGESPTRLCEGTAQKFRTGNQVWMA